MGKQNYDELIALSLPQHKLLLSTARLEVIFTRTEDIRASGENILLSMAYMPCVYIFMTWQQATVAGSFRRLCFARVAQGIGRCDARMLSRPCHWLSVIVVRRINHPTHVPRFI